MEDSISELTDQDRARYSVAWRRYKLLRNITAACFFVFVGCAALDVVTSPEHKGGPGSIWFVLAMTAGIALIPVGPLLEFWKCPRCQRQFTGSLFRGAWHQPWIRKCYWCKLHKKYLAAVAGLPTSHMAVGLSSADSGHRH